jgi:hypothetical protein
MQRIKRTVLLPKTFLIDAVRTNSSFPKRTTDEDVQLMPHVKTSCTKLINKATAPYFSAPRIRVVRMIERNSSGIKIKRDTVSER